jgi:hypothetical protein
VFVLSTPPSTVLEEIPIPLSQPRDQVGTRSEPGFLQLRNHIHGLIGKKKDDHMKSFVLDATVRAVELEGDPVT